MDYKQIVDLIKLINRSNLSEFRLKKGDLEISIRTEKYQKSKSRKEEEASTAIPLPSTIPSAYKPPILEETMVPDSGSRSETASLAEKESPEYLEIRSPMVGTFYRSSGPDKEPYVQVGDTIDKGSIVCIVEAMKLFNEIESEISGKIIKVIAEDASPVEYDQVLFLVKPD